MEELRGSRWVKCISTQGNVRGVAIQATDLVKEMTKLHQNSGIAARGLGESVIAALLIGSYCKAGERVNLNIQGSGHFKQALVDAYPDGAVRGYVIERTSGVDLDMGSGEDIGPWGTGMLSVLRTKSEASNQPYIGTVPLLTGHLAKDLTFYWAQSEQIPSSVGIVVTLDGDGNVAEAGGFLIQAMPGATPAEVQAIEKHIHDIHSLAAEFGRDKDPMKVLATIFQSTSFMVLEEKPLQFRCNCSWERVERALTLVGVQELRAMLAEDHQAMVRCDFCTKEYTVDAAALERLIDTASGGGSGSSH